MRPVAIDLHDFANGCTNRYLINRRVLILYLGKLSSIDSSYKTSEISHVQGLLLLRCEMFDGRLSTCWAGIDKITADCLDICKDTVSGHVGKKTYTERLTSETLKEKGDSLMRSTTYLFCQHSYAKELFSLTVISW